MDSRTYASILETICYADLFDYPLKEEEVRRWIKGRKGVGYTDIRKANGVIIHKDSFVFMKGREKILQQRIKREKITKNKLTIAQRIVSVLKFIPTVKLIGVSGSVAMDNAKEEDDIDLFIITSAKTIWFTRLLTTVVVEFFSERRRPGDKNVKNKICLNMFVDEQFLSMPKKNLYTAHEVCQLRVLFDRDNTYQEFLVANSWVKKYLPNAVYSMKYRYSKNKNPYILNTIYYILNFLSKKVQLWYMRDRLTTETISEGHLAFHPRDYTDDVMAAFEKRVSTYAAKI